MPVTLDQDVPVRLAPTIGDRILYDAPDVGAGDVVWVNRTVRPSLVIDVAGGWVHSVELHSGSYDTWSARVEHVKVVGRAFYTDASRERAIRYVQALSEASALRAQVTALTEERVEQEYRLELAEAVAREMRDTYPPRVYLPGDGEPARAEPVGPSNIVIRNAVFASGTGYVYRQMHEDEWYAAHLPSSVFSWEQVLGDGPCIEVTNPAGVDRLFDVLIAHRQYERDVTHALWDLERACDDYDREHGLEVPRDSERAGSPAEMRAIMARAATVMVRLSARLRAAGRAS